MSHRQQIRLRSIKCVDVLTPKACNNDLVCLMLMHMVFIYSKHFMCSFSGLSIGVCYFSFGLLETKQQNIHFDL